MAMGLLLIIYHKKIIKYMCKDLVLKVFIVKTLLIVKKLETTEMSNDRGLV